MNIDIWREKAAIKLKDIGIWLNYHYQRDVPYLTYGTLAGLTIWPLVEAAVTTGQAAPVIGAIYSVAGGVGGNLVANQIESWKDRAESPTEAEVIEAITQQVTNDDLRDSLDIIIEQLGAITLAQEGLNDDDRNRFKYQLRLDLEALGNLDKFEAELEGSGAIAQDGATAIGERGVILKDSRVDGSIVTGKIDTGGGDFIGRDKKQRND